MAASFLRRFVAKLATPAPTSSEKVYVAAFGKHPVWDDHMPDQFGLDTKSLIEFKQLLYGGIRGNIENGAWDKLTDGHQLVKFGHSFVWKTPTTVISGRLWQSTDGKGRTAYPMVVAIEYLGTPLLAAAIASLEAARALQTSIESDRSEAEFKATLDEARTQMRQQAASAEAAVSDDPAPDSVQRLSQAMHGNGADGDGLLRIMYHMDREMAAFRSGKNLSSASAANIRSQAIRVPRCLDSAAEAADLWIEFLAAELSDTAPYLAILPDDATWADLIVGPPSAAQLYCLRAPVDVLPLTNTIPYNLSPEFVQSTRERLAAKPQ